MPDTRFSFAALKEHLCKFIWIYVVGIAVCLVVANLLWSTTAPRLENEQVVLIYMIDASSDPEALADVSAQMLEAGKAEDERLESVEFESIMYSDPSVDYTSGMVLMTRLSTGDADVFVTGQQGMDQLVSFGTLLPLDDLVADGWLAEYGLEPYTVKVYGSEDVDEDGNVLPDAQGVTYVAGLRLDNMSALLDRRSFNNQGAYLALSSTSQNPEATQRAVEVMVDTLMKESRAGAQSGGAEAGEAQDGTAEAAEQKP